MNREKLMGKMLVNIPQKRNTNMSIEMEIKNPDMKKVQVDLRDILK